MPSKSELRIALKQARLSLKLDEVEAKSADIVRHLKQLLKHVDFQSVHYFEPIRSLNEVNIVPITEFLRSWAPRAVLHTSRKIDGHWQNKSSHGRKIHTAQRYDLIIVPMLGFDLSLHRLGYGGGYYDRLLSEQSQATKIGVCFELGKVTQLPTEAHDMSLDYIISERRVYVAAHQTPS
jgi:5-formyltetrahydrofolate cyclo-ligase